MLFLFQQNHIILITHNSLVLGTINVQMSQSHSSLKSHKIGNFYS
uniref:Uncharacterized protein n=1 Tax=Rhizophora mucronata TaxID=61149 RepID=A0A2P2M5U3_RHIMU